MKKFILLSLSFLILVQCSSSNESETVEEESSEEKTMSLNYQGLGKSSEEFVSNWNQLVGTISEDEETILYFSMNPDNVKWTSETKEVLYYSFGDSGEQSDINNVFVMNIFITDDIVSRIEFFAPTSKDEANAQQTKLFFLLILTLSDETLDKNGREAILTNLGLYDNVSDPKQLAGSVTKNGVQYILEPLVENNFLFGLSLYTSFTDKSGTN
jgi:ribosomal protein L24E